jgi:thioredoxin reductase (NADPH)
MTSKHAKVVIIGGGPAGYTAAIYAARAGLSPLQILGIQPGGQLMVTTDVENYPGFADVIQGPWLMEQMRAQAQHVGTEMVEETIIEVDFSKRPFRIISDSGNTFLAETVIIATGAQAKWLGLASEKEFTGYGVSGCATCDGFFFKNQNVMVVGGGNTAVEEALYLTNHAAHVTLVHRRDTLRAEKILQERLLAHPKISILWNQEVAEILGDSNPKKVTSVKLRDTKTQEITDHPIDGIFIAIGHSPQTEIFKNKLEMDAEGYLITKLGTTRTNIPGVFAAGDVQDKIYRQAVTAAGQGCMAALDVEKLLQELSFHS